MTGRMTTTSPVRAHLEDGVTVDGQRMPVAARAAFWIVAYVFAATMLGTTLPTPLYVEYQGQFHFSSAIVTVIFAVYAAGVLVALLLAGRSSDRVGRRPVLGSAVVLGALSTVVFIVASDVGWLYVGRVLSGFSAGLMTGTGTAALTDLSGAAGSRRASLVATVANMGGLGLGPLVAGLFAQYGPRPTVLVFEVYLGLLGLAALGVVVVPETVARRQPLSPSFNGLGLPDEGRGEFVAAGVAAFAAFSILGMFTALAPSFLGHVLREHNHAVGGVVVFVIFATATVTQAWVVRLPTRPVVMVGIAVFLAGLALIVAALSAASLALFLSGTVVAGGAIGAVFLGTLSVANRLAPEERRGQVVSTYFVFGYVGLIVPVIGVGVASEHIGDFRAVLICSIVLAVLSALSLTRIRRARLR